MAVFFVKLASVVPDGFEVAVDSVNCRLVVYGMIGSI